MSLRVALLRGAGGRAKPATACGAAQRPPGDAKPQAKGRERSTKREAGGGRREVGLTPLAGPGFPPAAPPLAISPPARAPAWDGAAAASPASPAAAAASPAYGPWWGGIAPPDGPRAAAARCFGGGGTPLRFASRNCILGVGPLQGLGGPRRRVDRSDGPGVAGLGCFRAWSGPWTRPRPLPRPPRPPNRGSGAITSALRSSLVQGWGFLSSELSGILSGPESGRDPRDSVV